MLSSKEISGYKTILHHGYTFSKGDFIEEGINKIDLVIHAGAFIPKNRAEADTADDCLSNILSVNRLINELPSVPEKFIFISTVDVYAGTNEAISEKTAVGPETLYGQSKLYGEKLLENWAKKENVVLQILRLGHVYGSGEEAFEKIIPATIRNAMKNESPVIYTSGTELRSFLHVSDCVNAILSSPDLAEYSGQINIVSGKALPIKQIVETIVKKISPELPVIIENKEGPVKNYLFDNSRMKQLLSEEKVSFEEGIEEEIKSFKA